MTETCTRPETICATYSDVIAWMEVQDPAVLSRAPGPTAGDLIAAGGGDRDRRHISFELSATTGLLIATPVTPISATPTMNVAMCSVAMCPFNASSSDSHSS